MEKCIKVKRRNNTEVERDSQAGRTKQENKNIDRYAYILYRAKEILEQRKRYRERKQRERSHTHSNCFFPPKQGRKKEGRNVLKKSKDVNKLQALCKKSIHDS